jgi:malonyl-CoA O-methyltransferase
MVPPIKAIDSERMRGNFSSHAEDYDSYASVQKRVVELLYGRLATVALQPGLCLDIGTGTGALASAMLNRVPGHNLVVMDIAHGMTRAAAGRLPSVSACDGDARQLPFASEVFACVVSSSVYQWVDCLPSAFTEVARVLSPGGSFALALFGEKTLCELRSSHYRAVEDSETRRTSHVQNFPTRDEVADAVAAAGLACDDIFTGMEVEFHLDVPDLLRQLKQIGASNATMDRPRGLASRRVMQSMIKFYEQQYRCESGLPASYEVIIAITRKSLR